MWSLDKESLHAVEAPTRRDLIYSVLGAILGVVLLPVQASRLHEGYADGRLLISGDWYVEWSTSPLGFALAVAMHLAITIFALLLLWYGVATVRHWLIER